MSGEAFRFDFAGAGTTRHRPGWISLSEADFRSSRVRLRSAAELASASTPLWAEDLLTLARAVHLADKRAPRSSTVDGWTRDIMLSVKVVDDQPWSGAPLTLAERILRVLSGDVWRLEVRGGAAPLDRQHRMRAAWQAEEIALFSGGLDSAAYAAERVREGARGLLLIGHDHGGAAETQERLFRAIDPGGDAVRLERVRDEPKALGGPLEWSTRTRGFLFAVTAVYTASAHGVGDVAMPENGLVALNPALTPDRMGASSDRSAHPWVLEQLNRLIGLLGGRSTVSNPYLGLSKGQVCARGREAGLSVPAMAGTVSCGSPAVARGPYDNCGHCYPCLVRRAGLHAALGADPSRYGREPGEQGTPRLRQHVDDVRRWLRGDFAVRDLIADMPLPSYPSPHELLPVVLRGREELRHLLLDAPSRRVPRQRRGEGATTQPFS